MKNRIRLTESQLHQVIKESVKKVLREDLEGDELSKYVDSLHLNDNVPYFGSRFTYDADGRKTYGRDREAPWCDDYGHRHYHPQSPQTDRYNTYSTSRKHDDLHGEGNFIKDDRWSARRYANAGRAQSYDYYWGLPDYYSYDAEQDLEDFNTKRRTSDDANLRRALDAADKRPLHRKGSLNRA